MSFGEQSSCRMAPCPCLVVSSLLTMGYAFDCSRLATAAFESILDASKCSYSKRASSWLVVRTYYASFYAAGAIARMLGISFTWLQKQETERILREASMLSCDTGVGKIDEGYYICEFNRVPKQVSPYLQTGFLSEQTVAGLRGVITGDWKL